MYSCDFLQVETFLRKKKSLMSYHLHHLHFSIKAELIHETLQILLHLNAVIIQLCHSKDPHLTLFPHLKKATVWVWKPVINENGHRHFSILYLVLAEQEWKQHEQASIMDNPPHVNGALSQTICVAWKNINVLCHKQGLVCSSRLSHCLCGRKELQSIYEFQIWIWFMRMIINRVRR